MQKELYIKEFLLALNCLPKKQNKAKQSNLHFGRLFYKIITTENLNPHIMYNNLMANFPFDKI